MKQKVVLMLAILAITAIALLYFTKPTPEEYVTDISKDYMQTDSSWGNFEILHTEDKGSYVVVKIKYQAKPDYLPKERWFIKDNVKVSISGFSVWEGNVYLVRSGLFRWQEIR